MNAGVVGEVVWVVGIVAWYVIRHPFERRAKRVRVVSGGRSISDTIGLASALFGLAVLPAIYVTTGFPEVADYHAGWSAIPVGAILLALSLWVFRRSHKELGRNWSITLEIRDKHRLIDTGPYAFIRHPMYTSFMLMGLGQTFLIPNWVAGLAGLVGFAILFSLRVANEERMMLENFGSQYRTYMERTKRLIPYLY